MRHTLVAVFLLVGLASCAPTHSSPEPTPMPFADTTPDGLAACRVLNGQADRRCTPGALNPNVTQATVGTTICMKGWTATVRPAAPYTNALKRKQMTQYGETGPPTGFEEDHLIPLEVGGSPTEAKNLWPEPRTGSHPASEKDSMENAVRAAVCAGRITLQQGQEQLVERWSR